MTASTCPPDCGCPGCLRRARALEREAERFVREQTGERLPSELNTKRICGDLSLVREKRESLARRSLPSLDVIHGRPNVQSHVYQREAVEREEERLSLRVRVLRAARADHGKEIAEHEQARKILRMIVADRTGAEIAEALGCSRPTAVERMQALLRRADDRYRRLSVVTVPCRWCGLAIDYRMGGRRPMYCPDRPGKRSCRYVAYWQRRGSQVRARARRKAARMAARKGAPPSASVNPT